MTAARRKICVVTGSRAEYGLLYWLMKEILGDPDLQLQLVVTGMHLSPEFGLTFQTIEADGFSIDAKVEMLLSSDSPVGIAKSLGLGVIGMADALDRLRPDLLVLLGDRYEILAAAQAAMVARIPIAHLHGGEATEGVIDEAIRHAVTKMSHFHFVAAEPYRQRVIQLGENPDQVFNLGAIGLDNILRLPLLSREQLQEVLEFDLGPPIFLVTYHPVTLEAQGVKHPVGQLLEALDAFPEARIVFTKSNSDTDGRNINQMIDQYTSRQPQRTKGFVTLGQLRYLSLLNVADVVIGNSSSGIIEGPALKTPTVNIGDRQRGRLKAPSVIDCGEDRGEIVAAIQRTLSPAFQEVAANVRSLYGNGGSSLKVKDVLKRVSLEGILMKEFHDMPSTS
jgi:UDP-hydrolysing UDP-N-acetyl-D-glucosamine 2-epimerase